MNLLGAVTWAFEFEDQPYFDGFRDLATNGIDKPVLNVFRMLGPHARRSRRAPKSSAGLTFESGARHERARRGRHLGAREPIAAVSRGAGVELPRRRPAGAGRDDRPDDRGSAERTRHDRALPRGQEPQQFPHERWKAMGSPQSPTPAQRRPREIRSARAASTAREARHDRRQSASSNRSLLPRQGVARARHVVVNPREADRSRRPPTPQTHEPPSGAGPARPSLDRYSMSPSSATPPACGSRSPSILDAERRRVRAADQIGGPVEHDFVGSCERRRMSRRGTSPHRSPSAIPSSADARWNVSCTAAGRRAASRDRPRPAVLRDDEQRPHRRRTCASALCGPSAYDALKTSGRPCLVSSRRRFRHAIDLHLPASAPVVADVRDGRQSPRGQRAAEMSSQSRVFTGTRDGASRTAPPASRGDQHRAVRRIKRMWDHNRPGLRRPDR